MNLINVKPGLYRIFWVGGGWSSASVGCHRDGTRWFAPTNWVKVPSTNWSAVKRLEPIEIREEVSATNTVRKWYDGGQPRNPDDGLTVIKTKTGEFGVCRWDSTAEVWVAVPPLFSSVDYARKRITRSFVVAHMPIESTAYDLSDMQWIEGGHPTHEVGPNANALLQIKNSEEHQGYFYRTGWWSDHDWMTPTGSVKCDRVISHVWIKPYPYDGEPENCPFCYCYNNLRAVSTNQCNDRFVVRCYNRHGPEGVGTGGTSFIDGPVGFSKDDAWNRWNDREERLSWHKRNEG